MTAPTPAPTPCVCETPEIQQHEASAPEETPAEWCRICGHWTAATLDAAEARRSAGVIVDP